MLEGVLRKIGTTRQQRGQDPLMSDDVRRVVATCPGRHRPSNLKNKGLLLVLFGGALRQRNDPAHRGQIFKPPGWVSVGELEDLLMAAIDANQGDEGGALAEIDDYFAGDETIERSEYKRALLGLLGLL